MARWVLVAGRLVDGFGVVAVVLVVLAEEIARFFAFADFFAVVACTDEAVVTVAGAVLGFVVLDVSAVLL